jgi:hypothetical protein
MKELDKDHDGYINIEEFKAAAVGSKDNHTTARMVENAAAAFNKGMPLPPMPLDGKDKKMANIPPPPHLAAIKIKITKVTKFSLVWNSQGSMMSQQSRSVLGSMLFVHL